MREMEPHGRRVTDPQPIEEGGGRGHYVSLGSVTIEK